MLFKLVIIIFLQISALNAGCFDGIQAFININPYNIKFSDETLDKVSMNDEILFPILKLKNIPEEHFFYLLSLYPVELIDKLLQYPKGIKTSLFYKDGLKKALNLDHYSATSTTHSLIDYFQDVRLSREEIKDWLEAGLKKIATLKTREYQELQKKTANFMQESQASFEFSTRYYVSLKMEVKGNEKNLIIANTNYQVLSDDPKNFIILVPKDKVKSPIWNPLERAKRESIIKNPEANQPPAAYFSGIGLDGHFYLEDGNHRFQMMEKRTMIPVKILFPPRTLTLSQFIYYVSNYAPTMSDKLKIHSHQLGPFDILPREIKEMIIFKSNQLQKK